MNKDSRSKGDLHKDLVLAFEYAETKFLSLYPTRSKPILTQTYRPIDVQNELYKIGRTHGKKGAIVTNAKGGESPHNFNPSFAFDIAFERDKKLDWDLENFNLFAQILLENYSETITWGGNFKSIKDKPHYELTGWKSKNRLN